MKYRAFILGLLVLSFSLMSCSKKSEAKITESTSVPVTTETVNESNENNSVIGTVESIEDLVFTVLDDTGKSYFFSFEGSTSEKIEKFGVGDKVEVTYTGKITENGILDGTINSIALIK